MERSQSEKKAATEKFRVALISVGAALFLTAAKAVVGFWTGSLALLSEAVHSGLDLFASLITMFSVRTADRPPDETHHYGHGKIESLSALFEASLLFLTCIWIIHEAMGRLFYNESTPFVNIYSFLVILVAIVVDFIRFRALKKTALKHHSQALEADALHFYSDMLSSSLVLIGLIAVGLGYAMADAFAALFVAGWVGVLSVRLGKKNLDILIDRVPEGYSEKIRTIAENTTGIILVEKLRLRRSGRSLFADLRVGVDRTLSFAEAHEAARTLEKKLSENIPGLDVVVHTDPSITLNETIEGGIFHFINAQGLKAHHLVLRNDNDQYIAELHLEVEGEKTIGEAHALAEKLEREIMDHFSSIKSLEIHFEERESPNWREIPSVVNHQDIVDKIGKICSEQIGKGKCHHIALCRRGEKLSATLHCFFPAELRVADVHQQTTILEELLLTSIPQLTRVLIHADPLRTEVR